MEPTVSVGRFDSAEDARPLYTVLAIQHEAISALEESLSYLESQLEPIVAAKEVQVAGKISETSPDGQAKIDSDVIGHNDRIYMAVRKINAIRDRLIV